MVHFSTAVLAEMNVAIGTFRAILAGAGNIGKIMPETNWRTVRVAPIAVLVKFSVFQIDNAPARRIKKCPMDANQTVPVRVITNNGVRITTGVHLITHDILTFPVLLA